MITTKMVAMTDDQRIRAIMKIKNQVRRAYTAQVVWGIREVLGNVSFCPSEIEKVRAAIVSRNKYISVKHHSENDYHISRNPDYEKQKLDFEITERVVKSYSSTRIVAWVSFAIAMILLFREFAPTLFH
jgi:hypothetical protein